MRYVNDGSQALLLVTGCVIFDKLLNVTHCVELFEMLNSTRLGGLHMYLIPNVVYTMRPIP